MTKKIFASTVLVAALVLVISCSVIMSVLYAHFTQVEEDRLREELTIASNGVESCGGEWLRGLDIEDFRITWIAHDGTVLYDSKTDPASMGNHLYREEVQEALASGTGESRRASETLAEKTLYCARLISDGTVLRISAAQSSVLALSMGMLFPLCLILAGALVLSAFLAKRVARRIVRPLNELDLEDPLANDAYEELSPLLTRIAKQHRQIDAQLRQLKRRQDEFTAITASMNEGLVLLNEKGAIVSINPAAATLFAADQDCVGQDFLTVERSREVEHAVEQALRAGHAEASLSRGGRQYQLDASRIRSLDKTAGCVVLAFDVTEKALAEQHRREFTANVSHELKTPIQSIMGSAELMEQGLVKPQDMQRFTGRIRCEAARMVTLIDDIIRLSELDEGAPSPSEPVELFTAVSAAADALREKAELAGVALGVSGEKATVPGVSRLINEIAFNLIDNAIKYNRANGRVDVLVRKTQCGAELVVSDTGIGIPREHQDRVFERFYRVDKSHSRATGGTGLGLSIVKHAAEALGAKTELQSTPGVGTVVTVKFQALIPGD